MDHQGDFAREFAQELKMLDMRVKFSDENESLGKRVRMSITQKVPVRIIIGDKEKESGMFAIELLDGSKKEGLNKTELIEFLTLAIKERTLTLS